MPDRLIHVLLFTNTDARYGAEEHMLVLLRGLDRKIFRPSLACPQELVDQFGRDLPEDVEVFPIRLDQPSRILPALRLARILRSRRIDILHSHMFQSSLYASPIGRLCRVPAIFETPHVAENWRKGWLSARFIVDRLIGFFVDHYIAVSRANAEYLGSRKGLPHTKITVIHNGTDLRKFNPSIASAPGLKASSGWEEGDPLLVVPARLEPQKGHRVLLKALRRVVQEFPRVRVACMGEGSLRPELEREAEKLGLASSVKFVGFQANAPEWFAASDFIILPSLYEGLPLVAIEALACARTVVASAVDGTPEIIVNGVTGLTVPPGDPLALAEAILELLRSPDLRRNLAHNGRVLVEENFNRDIQVKKTQDIYLRILRERCGGIVSDNVLASIEIGSPKNLKVQTMQLGKGSSHA